MCEIYALQMGVGGHNLPETNSDSALMFVACHGPAATHITQESINVVLPDAKYINEKGKTSSHTAQDRSSWVASEHPIAQ